MKGSSYLKCAVPKRSFPEYFVGMKIRKMKPAVDKNVLIFLSGFMWVCVGAMLLHLAWVWLKAFEGKGVFLLSGTGAAAALVIHHFGFLKIVDRNLGRILPMEGKRCVFSFMPWKSYIMVAVMILMGVTLRHSSIPKQYLSIIYIGIGLSLILSSFRYLRVFWRQVRFSGDQSTRTKPRLPPS